MCKDFPVSQQVGRHVEKKCILLKQHDATLHVFDDVQVTRHAAA
jgi:hypothetical protein